MGTLSHFPTVNSLSARKFFSSAPLPLPNFHLHHQQYWYSKISAASSKKLRASRKAKSDADLRNDIRKFLSAVGFPENHVPSTKELSQNGRQDLAKIVRRRGYKFIRQLLDASDTTNSDISCVDTDQTGKLAALSGSEGQNENLEVLANDVSSSEAIQEKDFYHDIEKDKELKLNDPGCPAPESTSLSMQEKVAKFIERGELDTIEDIHLEIGCTYEAEQNSESKHACEAEYASSHPEQKDLSFSRSIAAETLNKNAPLSISKNKHPLCENIASSGTVEFEQFCWSSYISALEETSSEKGLDIETQKMENQAEIKRLKFLLHQKELELTQLKQQIEKEKLSLSVLQTKAETAISNAQNIISKKETELHAAEESLSGLKEVEIQYSGDGEIVELAGSFNGWHHRTKMDLEPSSSIMTATGSRTSRLWRAVLWLYPGVYEIKFIVDGHWRIDPQRESISLDSFHNNILRVDR